MSGALSAESRESRKGSLEPRARRMERGLTAAEVADAVGLPVWDILAWERGTPAPAWIRARLAAYLLAHGIPAGDVGEQEELPGSHG